LIIAAGGHMRPPGHLSIATGLPESNEFAPVGSFLDVMEMLGEISR
jgi:hypothetical protein